MLKTFARGEWQVDFWVEDDGHCPTEQFLRDLLRDGRVQEAAQLKRRLEDMTRTVRGPHDLRGEHGHPMENDTYVVKTSGRSRLICFFDASRRRVIVCTHGFEKPANEDYRQERRRTEAIRARYEMLNTAERSTASASKKKGGKRK